MGGYGHSWKGCRRGLGVIGLVAANVSIQRRALGAVAWD